MLQFRKAVDFAMHISFPYIYFLLKTPSSGISKTLPCDVTYALRCLMSPITQNVSSELVQVNKQETIKIFITSQKASVMQKAFPCQAPVPLSIFRSNSKFDENSKHSSVKYMWPITTIFCTRHDSVTVVTYAKCRCDRSSIFETIEFWIFIEFRIRSKYA